MEGLSGSKEKEQFHTVSPIKSEEDNRMQDNVKNDDMHINFDKSESMLRNIIQKCENDLEEFDNISVKQGSNPFSTELKHDQKNYEDSNNINIKRKNELILMQDIGSTSTDNKATNVTGNDMSTVLEQNRSNFDKCDDESINQDDKECSTVPESDSQCAGDKSRKVLIKKVKVIKTLCKFCQKDLSKTDNNYIHIHFRNKGENKCIDVLKTKGISSDNLTLKMFTCRTCCKKFFNYAEYKKHNEWHKATDRFLPGHEKLQYESNLKKHVASDDLKNSSILQKGLVQESNSEHLIKSPSRKKELAQEFNLKQQAERVQLKMSPISQEESAKECNLKPNIDSGVLLHKGPKCSMCFVQFPNNYSLSKHMVECICKMPSCQPARKSRIIFKRVYKFKSPTWM